MNAKSLTIASAIVLFLGLALASASAQTNNAAAPAAEPAPAATPDAAAPMEGAPTEPGAVPLPGMEMEPAAEPAPPPPPAAQTEEVQNPYGLDALWQQGDLVTRGTVILLVIMSVGTWYIFFMKYWEQSRILEQAKTAEKRFWSAANLNEAIDKLAKNNVFRVIAERGVQATQRQSGVSAGLSLNDWLTMSLQRSIDDENGRLQSGIAFLASVGSTAPFVGLFGTVWGIYHALIAIGIAGQASIDKVAGPVGEALIMTAMGLGVAVPAVLTYNLLVRRNKVINEKMRSFANDLQTFLLSTGKK
ncbi:MAG: MotA/TolQ/ExbB proton channel family protein [Alphaproteobacteria bacterium]